MHLINITGRSAITEGYAQPDPQCACPARLVGDGDGHVVVGAQDGAHRVDALDGAAERLAAGAGRDVHPVAHQERLRDELRGRQARQSRFQWGLTNGVRVKAGLPFA